MTDLNALLTDLDTNQLDQLKTLIDQRRKVLLLEELKGLGLGSAVAFTNNVRPKYLAGVTGTVAGFAGRDKVSIKIDDIWMSQARIGRFGSTITAPLSLIQLR